MKRILIALAASTALIGAAQAGDLNHRGSLKDPVERQGRLPEPEVQQERGVNWTGVYVSAFGGWAWANWDGPLSYDDADRYKWLEFDDSDREIKDSGWFAGLGLGGDQQFGRIVVGVIADVAYADISGAGSFLPYPDKDGSPVWDIKTEIEYFGTARGRLGYLVQDNILIYATGGLAWAITNSSVSPVYDSGEEGEFVNGRANSDDNHIGWTIGAGTEWKITNNVSLSAEYLYFDLGKGDYAFSGADAAGNTYATDNYHPDLDLHVLKAGVNYRF